MVQLRNFESFAVQIQIHNDPFGLLRYAAVPPLGRRGIHPGSMADFEPVPILVCQFSLRVRPADFV